MVKMRPLLDDLPLLQALAFVLVLGLAIPMSLSTWVQLNQQRLALLEQLQADNARMVETLALQMQAPLRENRPESGRPVVEMLISDRRVTRVEVASTGVPQFLRAQAPHYAAASSVTRSKPVLYQSEEIGRVWVTMDTRPLAAQFRSDLSNRVLTGVLEFVIVLALVTALLRYKVLIPLQDLTKQAQALATGQLNQPLQWRRRDEIGVLGDCFEKMRSALRNMVADLKHHNQTLQTHEMELANQAAVFRAILDSMNDGITLVDEELRLVAWNDCFTRMMDGLREITRPGVAIKELFAHQLAPGGDSSYPSAVLENFLASFQPGKSCIVRYRLIDGRRIDIRQHPMPNGGFVSTYTDTTEEVEARRKADESRLLLEAVMDAVPALLHVKDRDLRYQLVNRRFLAWWGCKREDVLGKTNQQIFAVPYQASANGAERNSHSPRFANLDELLAQAQARDQKLLESGKPLPFSEIIYETGDPQPTTLWSTKAPLIGAGGRVTHIVSVGLDISERKQAEAELSRHREALHQSEKLSALGSLLAGIAHELNNPLSVVVGRAIMLEEQLQDIAAAASVRKIRAAAERCSRIVKTFLALARHQEPTPVLVPLRSIVEASLEMVGYRLRESEIDIHIELDPELPDLWVDPDQLVQVFTNLFLNAQYAMADSAKPRWLKIAARLDQDRVSIAVADNGPGIPAAIRSRIFEPFFTTKGVGEGTGVGLSVSYGIVEAHGGTLTVELPPHGGSVFIITLPVRAAEHSQEKIHAGVTPISTDAHILIVDDVFDVAQMLGDLLSQDGYGVETVPNGRAALHRLGEKRFDLILSDLRMPDLDGPGLYQKLQTHEPQLLERLIFITGDTLSETAKNFLTQTQRPVIEKPFVPEEIRRLVRQVLQYPPN